jgi:hypothetical protein
MLAKNDSPSRDLAITGALILELFARQLALFDLLRTRLGLDEKVIREAVRNAHQQLAKIPRVATLRSQATVQVLEELEASLRTLFFPTQNQEP